jgi:hypothetical protein
MALRGASALVDASAVAAYLDVDRSWVYEHADELGVRRLGSDPRAQLAFQPRGRRCGADGLHVGQKVNCAGFVFLWLSPRRGGFALDREVGSRTERRVRARGTRRGRAEPLFVPVVYPAVI